MVLLLRLIIDPLLLRNHWLHTILRRIGIGPTHLVIGLATLLAAVLDVRLSARLVARLSGLAVALSRSAGSYALLLRQGIHPVGELLRSTRGLNLRTAAVDVGQLTAIPLGSLKVLLLQLRGLDVTLAIGLYLVAAWADWNAAVAAVKADAVVVIVHDGYVVRVDVVNAGSAEVADAGVVEEAIATPLAALEARAKVAEAVVDASVEADVRAPVAGVEAVETGIPGPIGRGPEEARFRCHHPGAGDPVVAFRTIGPIAGSPEEAVAGADGLGIDGEHRWCESDLNIDLGERCQRSSD